MVFRVVGSRTTASAGDEILLVRDNWNDWFTWVTQFEVILAFEGRQRVSLGSVKIAKRGMTGGSGVIKTELPERFEALDESYYSIGQSEN